MSNLGSSIPFGDIGYQLKCYKISLPISLFLNDQHPLPGVLLVGYKCKQENFVQFVAEFRGFQQLIFGI